MSFSVEVKGTFPVLKYDLKKSGWIATVFIDDQGGDIVIQFDSRNFFGHWWRQPSLRGFLVGANRGYVEDKFSYGLDRWSGKKAIDDLYKMCTEKWGHIDGWPSEVAEMAENLRADDITSDGLQARLWSCPEFTEAFEPHDFPSGEVFANERVKKFVDLFWDDLVAHWKKELSDAQQNPN